METLLQTLQEFLWILVPLLIIQITLMIIGLWDWSKKREFLGKNKLIWLLVIIFFNTIGPITYLYYTRRIQVDTLPMLDDWE